MDQRNEGRPVSAAVEHWDSVAAAWAKWWPVIEKGAGPVSARMLDLAALAPGERVLDLASGIGEPAASAAGRVGPDGWVIATDLAPSMVALGRARFRELGLANVEFRQMDAGEPDLPAGSVDVVLCRWGLMFLADLDRTLERLHALLAPGGRLSAAVWGAPEQVPAISLATRILKEELDLPPPDEDEKTPFDLADTGAFKKNLERAGFTAFESEPVKVIYGFSSAEEFISFRRELSPAERRMAHIPEARRKAAWRAVAEALAPYRSADGRIVMENLSICVAARRR